MRLSKKSFVDSLRVINGSRLVDAASDSMASVMGCGLEREKT